MTRKLWVNPAFFILGFFVCFLMQACASKQGSLDQRPDMEVRAGEDIHSSILHGHHEYTDARVVNYVNDVGLRVAHHTSVRRVKYQFTVLYDERIYATSAPGGFVYITTGFLNFLDNEAQLAAVLGHEIAQSQYLDPRLDPIRKTFDVIAQTGATLAPLFGQIGTLVSMGFVGLQSAVYSADPTDSEKLIESDKRAMKYMIREGYDPQAMIDVMKKFLETDQDSHAFFADYYQSRPISWERLQAMYKVFENANLVGRDLRTNFETYQNTTRGVKEIFL